MEQDTRSRRAFQDRTWEGLDQMAAEYAREAQLVARVDFHEELGWAAASLDRLEVILNRLSPAPSPLGVEDGEWWSLLWGCWFGEWLRRGWSEGAWEMSLLPGTELAVPALVIAGARLFPTAKVHRRLSLGAAESLPAFYRLVRPRLEEALRAAGEDRRPG